MIGRDTHRFGHDSVAPELFSKPVANAANEAPLVLAWTQTDLTSEFAGNLDGEHFLAAILYDALQEGATMGLGVRMREGVHQPLNQIGIVGMADQIMKVFIAGPSKASATEGQGEFGEHGVVVGCGRNVEPCR